MPVPPKIDIQALARMSGATAENGGRAEGTFCFTTTELEGFAQRLTQALCEVVAQDATAMAAVMRQAVGLR